MTVWGELAKDAGGLALFVIWLVLPIAYVIVLGHRYVRQAQDAAQEAAWANEEAQNALDDLQISEQSENDSEPVIPTARAEDDTQEFAPVRPGRHRRDQSTVATRTSSVR